MTRVAKNPGSGKPPSNAPARGPGWGGAKGGDRARGAKAGPDQLVPGVKTERDPDTGVFLQTATGATREAIASVAYDRIAKIAQTSEYEPTVLDASKWIVEKQEGKAIQAAELPSNSADRASMLAIEIARLANADPLEAARIYQKLINR